MNNSHLRVVFYWVSTYEFSQGGYYSNGDQCHLFWVLPVATIYLIQGLSKVDTLDQPSYLSHRTNYFHHVTTSTGLRRVYGILVLMTRNFFSGVWANKYL